MRNLILVFIIILMVSCTPDKNTHTSFSSDETNTLPDKPAITTRTQTSQSRFHYQLQEAYASVINSLDIDYAIIDFDDVSMLPSDIRELNNKGIKVLSYLSIGEAEDYRDYWQSGWKEGNPVFLDEENPDWKGNYKVKFWDTEWQDIILKKVDYIANFGYNGIYLDIIDAYEYYKDQGINDADMKMIDFVKKISIRAKAINPDILIIPQNGVELYNFVEYRELIDGLGSEDTWYDDDSISPWTNSILPYLKQAKTDGKIILAIDYPKRNICAFYAKCDAQGFYCTVSNRDLELSAPLLCEK